LEKSISDIEACIEGSKSFDLSMLQIDNFILSAVKSDLFSIALSSLGVTSLKLSTTSTLFLGAYQTSIIPVMTRQSQQKISQ